MIVSRKHRSRRPVRVVVVVAMMLISSTALVLTTAATANAIICPPPGIVSREGSAGTDLVRCPGETEPKPLPSPRPDPVCASMNLTGKGSIDEEKAIARSALFGVEVAWVIPHIRWCTNTTTGVITIQKFHDLDVIGQSATFQDWSYVGEKREPYIDPADGKGHYIQTIRISAGAAIGAITLGLLGGCTMTINRVYGHVAGQNYMNNFDDYGDCQPIWALADFRAPAVVAPIPEIGDPVQFPPVEFVWVEPADTDDNGTPDGAGEMKTIIWEDGTTQDFISDDYVDSPLGDGGEGGSEEYAAYLEDCVA